MTIELLWKDTSVLLIQKIGNLFVSEIITENISEIRKTGFPIYFLKNINIISNELPLIVRNRIYSRQFSKEELKTNNYDKIPTDNFGIKIF